MMQKDRCFLAVKVPEFLLYEQRINRLSHVLDVQISITSPQNYHFTLHFFGDIDQVDQEKVVHDLKTLKFKPFSLELKHPGTIPANKPEKTRVLYIDPTEGRDELIDLTMDIRSSLSAIGFGIEKRRYLPHLTVARVRRGNDIRKLYHRWLEQNFETKQFMISSFKLIKSDLSGSSPRYTTIAEFQAE